MLLLLLLTYKEIEKLRAELAKAHRESREQELNQAVELALSQAHADWLKNEEEMRQREIDQAVEVATTNAVAEAKEEWEREIKSQVSSVEAQRHIVTLHAVKLKHVYTFVHIKGPSSTKDILAGLQKKLLGGPNNMFQPVNIFPLAAIAVLENSLCTQSWNFA